MTALDRQVGGEHYKRMPKQPWEVIREELGPRAFGYYLLGNVCKYRMRVGHKEGSDDAGKAEHYEQALRELIDEPGLQYDLVAELTDGYERMQLRLVQMGK